VPVNPATVSGIIPPVTLPPDITYSDLVTMLIRDIPIAIFGAAGSARAVAGPGLPQLPAGTEYVWFQTDGAGELLDILSGVA
jgi:hypothetical protein